MTEERVIRSYVCNRWHGSQGGFVAIRNPSTEEVIGEVSSEGIDFSTVLEFGRETGGDALRKLTFAQRAGLLKEMSKALRTGRDELLELSRLNNGTTQGDGAFDIDGATGTLAYYAHLGSGLGDVRVLVEDDRAQLSRGGSFVGGHVLTPRSGVAVHINAFNFPAWGFAEKAACALLAGMPVITKPATATARVTESCVELIVEAGILPEGVLQMVCGSLGDLLSQLGSQDVVAFTGSAETAERVRAQVGPARMEQRRGLCFLGGFIALPVGA